MNIEIKKSIKPIKYEDAIKLLEERLLQINNGQKEDLIWTININNDLSKYKNIIPCGISDKGVINLKEIKDQDYKNLDEVIIETFSKNLEI